MINLRYVVAGTGRCGTVFVAKLLTSLGVPCSHEGIFNSFDIKNAIDILRGEKKVTPSDISCKEGNWISPGELDRVSAESSYMAAPFLDSSVLKCAKVVHLIRNPLKVISSFCLDFGYFACPNIHTTSVFEGNVYSVFPEITEISHNGANSFESRVLRNAAYYVKWNNMVEDKCRQRDHLVFPYRRRHQPSTELLPSKTTSTHVS